MPEKKHIDIEYTAKLARINLTDEEKAKFYSQLDSIIGYVEKLEELNTENGPPAPGDQRLAGGRGEQLADGGGGAAERACPATEHDRGAEGGGLG